MHRGWQIVYQYRKRHTGNHRDSTHSKDQDAILPVHPIKSSFFWFHCGMSRSTYLPVDKRRGVRLQRSGQCWRVVNVVVGAHWEEQIHAAQALQLAFLAVTASQSRELAFREPEGSCLSVHLSGSQSRHTRTTCNLQIHCFSAFQHRRQIRITQRCGTVRYSLLFGDNTSWNVCRKGAPLL